jgi:hypothetical protein
MENLFRFNNAVFIPVFDLTQGPRCKMEESESQMKSESPFAALKDWRGVKRLLKRDLVE